MKTKKKNSDAMPLRTMIYDSLNYYKEYQEISSRYKSEKPTLTPDEFLSKMKKSDRLHPVITLIIYYGEIPWDGPLCLQDMMIEMPLQILDKFSNYQMNLIQVRDSTCYTFQNQDVQTVFELSQLFLQGNQTALKTKSLNRDLAEVVGSIVGFGEILQFMKKEKGELINMCTLLDQIEQSSEKRGEKRSMELIARLIADNQLDDISKITVDTKLYKQLLKKYKIE